MLPIGGLKEKALGAHRAGIHTVILPKANEPDLEEVPAEVRDALEFHAVARLEEVLEVALVPSRELEAQPEPFDELPVATH